MNELIKKCRYYKGEKKCPSSLEKKGLSNIWYYEQIWIEREDLRDENSTNTKEYISLGLEGFNADDGVPISLKALLFNRHSHWTDGYGIESDENNFKEWYFNFYLVNNIER